LPTTEIIFGKQSIPWTTTVSYFFDKDLTPEGIAAKYVRGPFFANAVYTAINERDSATSSLTAKDADMYASQIGWKQAIGKVTWTAAAGYFALNGIRDRVVSAAGGCTIDGAFGSGQGTGNNAFGNTTYTGGALNTTGSSTSCVRLLNDYNLFEVLAQADWTAGKYPISVFVDYIKNNGVLASQAANKQDTAVAAGFLFNKASAAKSWEIGYVYQQFDKDGVWTGFTDSDYAGGSNDSAGGVLKLAYIPATNWTLNAQYFMNNRFVDNSDATPTRSYRRLQLDLNFKY
jgi:hypothetical protein